MSFILLKGMLLTVKRAAINITTGTKFGENDGSVEIGGFRGLDTDKIESTLSCRALWLRLGSGVGGEAGRHSGSVLTETEAGC